MPKTKSQPWWKTVDPDEISGALEEATVDCYEESEQHLGLVEMMSDELQFPFKARVLGQTVEIVAAEYPPHDSMGLDLICEIDGTQHRVAARNVELIKPFPEGYAFLAAFLDWKSRF